ncbi:DUF262 domain-containing protein [Streptomyces althioticus]|uniref:DUF262 domain-containing protein n=1 Tax=Streptomyces althioticus TaxID=83380 RepID=UPI00331F9F1C
MNSDDQTEQEYSEVGDAEELFGESEDDLENLRSATTFDAYVVSSDWTTETLLGQIERANIELDPIFQRRDAWDRKKKSRFIESLIVGLPVPQIVLAERKGRKGKYIVLDGKQRLLTLIQFSKGEFNLTGLELRSDLNKKNVETLPDDEKLAFETQTLRTMVVRHWQGDEFLYLVFHRLNTASVPLSPQELRQALYPGPFVAYVNEYTTQNLTFAKLFGPRSGPDFRMRDVELLVRHFAFVRFLPRYTGNLKELLDYTCARLNKEWNREHEAIKQEALNCSKAVEATLSIFGKNAFRRYSGDDFERPFNRAIFDIMCFYAQDSRVRDLMIDRAPEVRRAFVETSADPKFSASLTSTTKSLDAVATRLETWGDSLARILDVNLPVPRMDREGRIAYAQI